MYEPDRVRIEPEHYDVIAAQGERVAVIAAINHDVAVIPGVYTFYDAGFAQVVESAHPNPRRDTYDRYCELLKYYGDAPDVITSYMQEIIDDQDRSDDPTKVSWELMAASEEVRENEDVQDVLSTVIEPERLDPPFDAPSDGSVAVIDCSYEQHDIISEANSRYGYAVVDVERFRGKTYLLGVTEDRLKTISKGCFKLKGEYSDMDLHDSTQAADRAETLVHRAELQDTIPTGETDTGAAT